MLRNKYFKIAKSSMVLLAAVASLSVPASITVAAESLPTYLSATPTLEFKNGRLTSIFDKKGQTKFSYIDGYLREIIDTKGAKITFTYAADGKLEKAYHSSGKVDTAKYSRHGELLGFASST